MKKCPQCNTVYANETVYCLNDGTPLVEENLVLPSTVTNLDEEEEVTVIHHDPITINIPETASGQETVAYPNSPDTESVTINPPPGNRSNAGKYVLFLFLGLLIGGGLVLGAIIFSNSLFRNGNSATNRNAGAANNKPVKSPEANSSASNRHLEANKIVDEDELNGRVIKVNAFVRSAPGTDSSIVDTLPMNDRLKIGERENDSSPWYKVTCEHGTSGWMHGNTIEFTKDHD